MYNRLNQLSFVIGLFFTLTSIVLFANAFLTAQPGRMSVLTASVFMVFGLMMMFIKNRSDADD